LFSYLAAVRALGKGKNHTGMIQDLNDLTVLGKENPELLQTIHFDMSLLDKAAQMSGEIPKRWPGSEMQPILYFFPQNLLL
jgi:hypothetical protein